MDSIIELNDLEIEEYSKGIVKAKVTDKNGNPLNGKAVIKLNQTTKISGRVVDGIFSEEYDFSDLHNEEYEMSMIFGGTNICDPAEKKVKLTIKKAAPIHFKIGDIQNACYRLTKWIDIHKKLPGKIAINDVTVSVSDLLYAVAQGIVKINNNEFEDIELVRFASPKVSSESIKDNILIDQEEYVYLANLIVDYVNKNKVSPSSVESSEGKIGYMNLVYTYATIIANSSENNLISGVYVKPWKSIIAK